MKRVLIIDDDEGIRQTLNLHLSKKSLSVLTAGTLAAGRELWLDRSPQIVLLDQMLPDGKGTDLLQEMVDGGTNAVVIMITGQHEMEYVVQAMKSGAYNYIHKPLDVAELDGSLESALRVVQSSKHSDSIDARDSFRPHRIVGRSRAVFELHKQIGIASKSRVNVLIMGSSGTGKELVARSIHEHSSPSSPFVAVNCSAIVPTLAESEFFGHEKGAFTGAHQQARGKLHAAGDGTLFLDEIGDMSLDLQAKLLRVLQERQFVRVGGQVAENFEARVISATNKNLAELVAGGEFREDLYFRLRVMEIEIPPLDRRKDDIPDLVDYLLEKINRDLHRRVTKVPHDVIARLQRYAWPGNVRELENVLTQAVVRTSGDVLQLEFLPEPVTAGRPASDEPQSLSAVEKEHIAHILKLTGGNLGETCRILGISRPTLRRKIEEHGLEG